MKNILCPIDFSEASLNALEFAANIGSHEKGAITLLNIFTEADFNKILKTDHLKEKYEDLLGLAESKLKAIADEIMRFSAKDGLQSCSHKLMPGEIVDIVSLVSGQEQSELIVIGTTGHSAFERKYIGGNAEKIIRHAHCPVLCIPESHSFHEVNRIVYATDYQEEDKLAIQHIVSLAKAMDAEIKIVHVSHHNHTVDKAIYEDFVNELSKFVHYERTTFDRLVFENIAHGLDLYVKEIEADLLVMLSKKRNVVESLFHNSLTDHLDKFADYPIMVLKL